MPSGLPEFRSRMGSILRAMRSAALALAVCQAPVPVPLDDPVPAPGRPLAPRGGVIAIPLELPPVGRSLATAVPVRIGGGADANPVEGRVGWIVELGPAVVRRWTDAPSPYRIVEVADGVDPRTALDLAAEPPRVRIVGAMLLAEVPPCVGDPVVSVGDRTVTPRWFDPAPPLPAFDAAPARTADDEPDATAPSEWFRHAIRADLTGTPPPAPPGDATSRLFARHVADLWRGGLARIEPRAPAFAQEVRERLVAVATEAGDQSRRVAAWIAAPAELDPLLAILHDADRDEMAVATATGAWLDVNAPLAAWLDGDSAGTVRVSFLNGGGVDRTLVCSWIGASEVPVAAHVPARSWRTVTFERPAEPSRRARPTGDGAEPLVLWLRGDGFEKRITVPFAATPARPPMLNLGSFSAPFTLAEAKDGVASAVSPRFATSALVRRRGPRWEVLVECRRDALTARDDRLTLEWNGRRIEIAADGSTRVRGGEGPPPETAVAAGPDLWRARVAFPDSWIPEASPAGVVVPIAVGRRAGEARRTAIVPRPAISPDPAPVEIELAAWER